MAMKCSAWTMKRRRRWSPGREFGKGKVIFIGTRFDPHSQLGYSHYPFMLEYIRTFFGVAPVLRREGLGDVL